MRPFDPRMRSTSIASAVSFIVDRIFITATVASYRPMFRRAQELLFGDAAQVFARDSAGHESHLDRTINVIGSGFQHEKYFAALSKLLVKCFDGDAYASQPKYIVDMGCGDGSLLRRLYETVRDRTPRGKVLDTYPLIPVAVDFNQKALAQASRTLDGIEHIAIQGDIGESRRTGRHSFARRVLLISIAYCMCGRFSTTIVPIGRQRIASRRRGARRLAKPSTSTPTAT